MIESSIDYFEDDVFFFSILHEPISGIFQLVVMLPVDGHSITYSRLSLATFVHKNGFINIGSVQANKISFFIHGTQKTKVSKPYLDVLMSSC